MDVHQIFDFNRDPIENFLAIFSYVEKNLKKDPNAMSLATSNKSGTPSVRTVLFKGMIRGGFSFYTNYQSQKGKELIENPKAALLFYWPAFDMQIRLEGAVEKLTRQESEDYFRTRARLSQIGAWASHQSEKIESYEEFAQRVQELEKKFENTAVPCPPNWGGFHLLPLTMEFWFAKLGRLHERYVYQRKDVGSHDWEKFLKNP